MLEVLTPAQMKAADEAAIASGVPSALLMERAGWAVARAALRLAGGSYGRRVAIVCGKGNNAGDGFVTARYLAAAGAHPTVFYPVTGEATDLKGDAALMRERLGRIRVRPFDTEAFALEARRSAVVVDALVGTGLRGPLKGDVAGAAEAIDACGRPVVAVDIPSGVEGEDGKVEGVAVHADVTVTMAALKSGLVLQPGADHTGEIEIADIGIPPEMLNAEFHLVEENDVRRVLPERPPDAHKRSVGVVLVVAGSLGMSGAAALTASGALRMGAGLVTVAAPATVAPGLDLAVVEATTLPLEETPRGTIEASASAAVLQRAATSDAVALGPGLSRDPETSEFVRKVVSQIEIPLVLDADGINHFEGDAASLAGRRGSTIITPHPGEAARLLGISTAEVQADRVASAREAARRADAVTLLKGYRTVVARPDGETVLIPTGGPALATGGAGDVLTGMVAALAAAGLDPFEAAWAAAYLHGATGDFLAARMGDRSPTASDLLEEIGVVESAMGRD